MKQIITLFFLINITLLTACSSSDSDSPPTSTGAATITTENAQDLAIAATESTKQGVSNDAANSNNPFSSFGKNNGSQFDIQAFSEKLALQSQQAPGDILDICSGGGSFSDNIDTATGNASYTFNNCNIADTVIINGTMSISTNVSGDTVTTTLEYNDFSYTINGITETVDFTMICTVTGTSASCSTSSSVTGLDGLTYSISDVSISGNTSTGYNVSATVDHPTHGTVSISASNVLFNCTNDNPSVGSITFTAGNTSGSITFNSCTSYTVTVDGLGTSYNW